MTRSGISGAVAAGHTMTAEAAATILREGGNAFDAAIAGLWMACIVEPVLASPGGGGFLMASHAGGRQIKLFDFFVETPGRKQPLETVEFESVHVNFGTATQEFHVGAGASAVPGFVPGLFAVHDALGSIPMPRLVEQACEAARRGVAVSDFQARLLKIVEPIYLWSEGARSLYAPNGDLVHTGDTYTNAALADAIEAIASEGARIATEGEIARAMLESVAGGCLDAADFKRFAVALRDPQAIRFHGYSLYLNPPPSSGGSLIGHMLGQANAFQGQRPSAMDIARMITNTDQSWRDADGDLHVFLNRPAALSGGHANRGTTHISVVDRQNNVAAVTVSNGEGNGHVVPGCGFMVNNMLGEEDLNQGGFYAWQESARLASMMAPTIALDAEGGMTALGSGGSNRIRSAIFQVLNNLIANRQPVEAAVVAPRLHVERNHLDFEDLFPSGTAPALMEAFPDHRAWAERNMFFGGVHVVRKTHTGSIEAAGDPRRAGAATIV